MWKKALALGLAAVVGFACSDAPTDPEIRGLAFDAGTAADVPACHVDGTGAYSLLFIAEPALPGHLGHGDAQPGDPVPGMEGFEFDESCQPVHSCPPPGLIHWWPADGNSTSDVVGAADLTAFGGAGFTAAGKAGDAFSTSGSAIFRHDPATQPLYSGDFTIDLWVKPSVPVSSISGFASAFASRDGSGTTGGFQIEKCGLLTLCTANSYSLDMRMSGGINVDIDFGPIVQDWRHLAATYNDVTGDVVTYYQGIAASTATLSDALRIDLIKVGRNRDGSITFPGSIDEVHIFDRVLTAQEIQQIFDADGAACSYGS